MRDRRLPFVAGLILVCGTVAPAAARTFACPDFLRMHGFLRQATAVCRFSAFNPAIVEQARECFEEVGSSIGATEIYSGAAQFDRLAAYRNLDAVCVGLSTKFPTVVRP